MNCTRRAFFEISALAGAAPPLASTTFPSPVMEGLEKAAGDCPLDGAQWYQAATEGAGMTWRFAPGDLLGQQMLSAGFLLDGNHLQVFTMQLKEGDAGRTFRLTFAGLTQCSFRMRMNLALTDQNRWQADREGAFLKPLVGGDRVELAKVDRITLRLHRKAPGPARFAMTALRLEAQPVPKMASILLPKGALLDELGQSRLHDWPGRTPDAATMSARLREQYTSAQEARWPDSFTRWGGWKSKKIGEGSGTFRVAEADGRWWLVDPDGYAFWSAGADCVRVDCDARIDGIEKALTWLPPEPEYADAYKVGDGRREGAKFVSYLAANFIRTFGRDGWRDKWSRTALSQMKRLRFNTVGNWSEWSYASKARYPYVRPLDGGGSMVPRIYRDFPDVFAAEFPSECARMAESLRPSAHDPALIGYFLMNEPAWGFSTELPAAGMLYVTDGCATREELVRWLKQKYPGPGPEWQMAVTWDNVARGRWKEPLTSQAQEDLRGFSVKMVERYFHELSGACRKVDPKHLNLGMRWAGVPPDWAVEGMKTFDVFSLNCYMEKLPRDRAERIQALLKMPVMVGEWHFGALDAGLPGSGIGHVRTQADRGRAYRAYLEDAAANPLCVGVHWFTLYDQSAMGRFDGENYNIGFLDICHRPYAELAEAAIASHERMYAVAAGRQAPFADAPGYLPKLFL